MSKSIEAELAEAEELISKNLADKAFRKLIGLFQQCSQVDLKRLEQPINEILSKFWPKRQRDLRKAYLDRIGHRQISNPMVSQAISAGNPEKLETFIDLLNERFDELSEWHIFQWSTYYKDELRKIMGEVVDLLRSGGNAGEAFNQVGVVTKRHSTEIFAKGFRFVMSQQWSTKEAAIGKSLGGLRSFLELPVEIYADESSRITDPKDCRVLRTVTSRILRGVLTGFLDSNLGDIEPSELLIRTAKNWVHVLPLMEKQDLAALGETLNLESIAPILGLPLQILTGELDHASSMSSVDAVVVTAATVNINDACIDITLRPPTDSSDTRPLEVAVLSGEGQLVRHQIEQRAKLGYIACITPRPAQSYWKGSFTPKEIRDIAITMPDGADTAPGILLSRLRLRFYEKTLAVQQSVPLKTNIAERFPLENPTLLTFFRVERPSVRALHTTLSTRTGVLLWCSVRRSGKTTGVSELANGIADRNAIFQRCELTGGDKTSRLLFEEVSDALDSNSPLPRDFLRGLVSRAAPMGGQQNRGSILIVDEYDRLFGRMRVAGRKSEDSRHLVIQPLLDQFVEFATENLLILLGQQPNAHYIFMDQNQLSAYVQQEPYPLFNHEFGLPDTELHELIRRTFQKTLSFSSTFVDSVYEETGGHPFLAINLLRDFVDWLIEKKIVPSDITINRDTFDLYAIERLRFESVGKSRHFQYFRSAASEALSREGAEQSPWIHSAYKILRHLALQNSQGLMATKGDDIEDFVATTLQSVRLGSYTPSSYLSSAAESNFIELSDGRVRAKIPLLARIAAAVGVAE